MLAMTLGALGVRREVADLHIFDHAVAKRRHGWLLCGIGAREGAVHGPASGAVRRAV